jgi:hypothetical protein
MDKAPVIRHITFEAVRWTRADGLVMMFVFFAEILIWFLIESFLAPERTEVIGLAFILGFSCGTGGVDIHSADGIMYRGYHKLSPFISLIIGLSNLFKSAILLKMA